MNLFFCKKEFILEKRTVVLFSKEVCKCKHQNLNKQAFALIRR
jgi:hypothetical protein